MIKIQSLLNGRTYGLKPGEVKDFLANHIHGAGETVRRRIISNAVNASSVIVGIGIVSAVLFGPDGSILNAAAGCNLITDLGKAAAIDRLQAASVAVHDYIAIGTGATAAAAGDTTLVTEVARIQGTLSQPDAVTDRCVATFSAGTGTGVIAEAGRLNAASSGNLFARYVLGSTINKTASDALTMTYDIGVS